MEEKKKVALGVLFLTVLALLTFLRVAFAGAVDDTCCDWWSETVEWPVGASQCPATLEGANATYCCGLCRAALDDAPPEKACPQEEEELPAAVSGAPSGSLHPALLVLIPVVFLLLFVCAWLWMRVDHESAAPVPPPTLPLPPRYGAFFQKFATGAQEPQDLPSLSGETPVRFRRSSRGDDDDIWPPVVILGNLEEELEPVSGGAPEEEPVSGGAPEEEPASGGAPEAEPASRGAPEAEPASRGAPEAEPASRGAPEEEPASGGAPEKPALPTE